MVWQGNMTAFWGNPLPLYVCRFSCAGRCAFRLVGCIDLTTSTAGRAFRFHHLTLSDAREALDHRVFARADSVFITWYVEKNTRVKNIL